jgi:MYXO-CTERM domain-containing protein
MKYFIGSCAALAVVASAQAQGVIAQWTFDDNTTSTSMGSGTASLIGGTTASFATGASGSPDRGWNTTTYAAQGTGSGTRGAQFDVSTVGIDPGADSISFTFDLRTSNTASRWYRVDYTVDGGSSWTLGTATRLGEDGVSAGDTWHLGNTFIIGDAAALNNALFGVRVVSVFSPVAFTQYNGPVSYGANEAYESARNPISGTTSAYGGGTWRFDNVTVAAVPAPGAIALLGLAGIIGTRRRRAA